MVVGFPGTFGKTFLWYGRAPGFVNWGIGWFLSGGKGGLGRGVRRRIVFNGGVQVVGEGADILGVGEGDWGIVGVAVELGPATIVPDIAKDHRSSGMSRGSHSEVSGHQERTHEFA